MSTTAETTIRNGVDTEQLFATLDAITNGLKPLLTCGNARFGRSGRRC